MFREKQDILRMFTLLDEIVVEPLEAFVIGGANLIAQEFIHRETHDIDVVFPRAFSESIRGAVETIAKKEGIHKKWINTMPSLDEPFLEPGWKERSSLFFQGKHLRIFLLSRKDILGQKLAAAADRARRDAEDILEMNPTEEEWAFAQAWARQYDGNPDWPKWIDQLVEQLKERQRCG